MLLNVTVFLFFYHLSGVDYLKIALVNTPPAISPYNHFASSM